MAEKNHRVAVPALAVMAVISLLPGAARAAKKVAVLTFSGPRGGAATRLVAKALSRQYRVVSNGAFVSAAKKRGANPRRDKGRVIAARALRVAAYITGSVKRRGARWMLQVKVHSGRNGRVMGRTSLPLRSSRVDSITARRIPGGLRRGLARAQVGPPLRGRPAVVASTRHRSQPLARRSRPRRIAVRSVPVTRSTPVVRPATAGKASSRRSFDDGSDVFDSGAGTAAAADPVEDEDEDPPGSAVASGVDSTAGTGDNLGFEVDGAGPASSGGVAVYQGSGSINQSEEARVTRRGKTRPPWEKLIDINVGFMMLQRTFDFNEPIKPAKPLYGKRPSWGIPIIVAEASIYPLSFFHRGPGATLGIKARYLRSVYLNSSIQKISQPGYAEPINTIFSNFEIGLTYRWNILDQAWSPTLKVGADFGFHAFTIQYPNHYEIEDRCLPNLAYYYLNLALVGLEVPFYATNNFSIGAGAGFDYLLIFSSGEIERTDQTGYGRSSTGGIEVDGGLFISYKGWSLKLNGFYRRIFFDFDNACYPVCNAAGGALDIYAGGYVMIGYAY